MFLRDLANGLRLSEIADASVSRQLLILVQKTYARDTAR
jgi:hypothetical protein